MYCPNKFAHGVKILEPEYFQCETTNCAWWNERFGMCCIAVDAYLKGVEDSRREAPVARMDSRY